MRISIYTLFAVLLLASCGDESPIFDNTLQLDGSNSTAPIFDAGDYENAVYFSASIMEDKVDRQLREIEFFLYEAPSTLEVVVYGEGSVTRPGNVLYSAQINSNLRANNWNTHVLSNRLTLDGNPIWISVKFTNTSSQQTIGCDAGPRKNGGDHLFNNTEGWTTFQSLSGESINWNIRGDLVPQ